MQSLWETEENGPFFLPRVSGFTQNHWETEENGPFSTQSLGEAEGTKTAISAQSFWETEGKTGHMA